VKENVQHGAVAIKSILSRLEADITKTIKYYPPNDWNQDILNEALELLQFQLNFFSTMVVTLKKGCQQ
jgi:hypothetical protein